MAEIRFAPTPKESSDKKGEALTIADRLDNLHKTLPFYFAEYARDIIFSQDEKKDISSPSIQIITRCIHTLHNIPSLLDAVLGTEVKQKDSPSLTSKKEKEEKGEEDLPTIVKQMAIVLDESEAALEQVGASQTATLSGELLQHIEKKTSSSSSQPSSSDQPRSWRQKSWQWASGTAQSLFFTTAPKLLGGVKTVLTENRVVHWGSRAKRGYSQGRKLWSQYTEIQALWEESGFSLYSESGETLLEDFLSLSLFDSHSSETFGQRFIALILSAMPEFNERDTHLMHSFFGMKSPASPATPELPPPALPVAVEPSPVKRNPTLHGSREWFPPLDFSKGAVIVTELISSALKGYENSMKEKGQADVAELKLIEDTHKALQGVNGVQRLDSEGYYIYLSEEEGTGKETSLSQSIKALFNITWAINEALRGNWENTGMFPKTRAKATMAYHFKKAYDNYWKISWPGISKEAGIFHEQIVKMMLLRAGESLFPALIRLNDVSHEIEWSLHLRFGFLSEFIQLHFDPLEDLFHKHGIGSFDNPFGYNAIEEKALEKKLADAQEDERSGISRKKKEEIEIAIRVIKTAANKDEICADDFIRALCTLDKELSLRDASRSEIKNVTQLLFPLLIDVQKQSPMPSTDKPATPPLELKQTLSSQSLTSLKEIKLSQDTKILTSTLKTACFKLLSAAKRRQTALEERQWDIPRYTESLQRLREMRNASLCRRLKGSGLITLLEAAQNPQAEYNLASMSDKPAPPDSPKPQTIYIKKTASGLLYEILGEDKKPLIGNIKFEDLPKTFSIRDEKQIIEDKAETLPTILKHTSNAGHTSLGYIQEKRQLAILLADFYKEDRITWIQDAHNKVRAFVKDANRIKAFIVEITRLDPTLGHALSVELYFAGYIDAIEEEKERKSNPRQTVCHLLDRLLFKHIQNMALTASNVDAERQSSISSVADPLNIKRGQDFLRLIQGDKSASSSSLGLVDDSIPTPLSLETFIDTLVKRYAQEEEEKEEKEEKGKEKKQISASSSESQVAKLRPTGNEIRNKIGLFLGRIAHANPAIANMVLKHPKAREIVKKECLAPPKQAGVKSEKALYYESLVHTLSFNYPNEAHEQENRLLGDFLEANSSIVCAIHASTLDQQKQEEKKGQEAESDQKAILAIYKADPAKLFEDAEKFIKTCLSLNGIAREKMCQFFSALLLCRHPKMQEIRLKMLDWYVDYRGLSCTKYMELLTPEASCPFWELIKAILIQDNYREKYYHALQEKQAALNQYLSSKGPDVASQVMRDQFAAALAQVIESKKTGPDGRQALLRRGQGNSTPLNCRLLRQAVQAAEKEVEMHCAKLYKEIDYREEKKDEFQRTKQTLQDNIAILESYKTSRNAQSAWLLACLWWPLRYEKIKLVEQYLTKFKGFLRQLDTITGDGIDIDSLQGLVMQDMEQLTTKHDVLAKTPEEKGFLSGKLSYISSRAKEVTSKEFVRDEKAYEKMTKEDTYYAQFCDYIASIRS